MNAMGVRMKIKVIGFKVTDLKVNGELYSTSKIYSDVTSITIAHKNGTIHGVYPLRYNVGPLSNPIEITGKIGLLRNTKTADMKIRISEVDAEKQTFMIDYLFRSDDLADGFWFNYDPTLAATFEGAGRVIKQLDDDPVDNKIYLKVSLSTAINIMLTTEELNQDAVVSDLEVALSKVCIVSTTIVIIKLSLCNLITTSTNTIKLTIDFLHFLITKGFGRRWRCGAESSEHMVLPKCFERKVLGDYSSSSFRRNGRQGIIY